MNEMIDLLNSKTFQPFKFFKFVCVEYNTVNYLWSTVVIYHARQLIKPSFAALKK